MNVGKIKIIKLKPGDYNVFAVAVDSYKNTLKNLIESENRAQQYIHYSILNVFYYELLKKINVRQTPILSTINIELSTAFIAFDALQFYSNQCDNHFESAVLNRLMISIHSELPRTSDGKKLSILSELNFRE